MQVKLKLKLQNLEKVQKALDNMQHKIEDMTPLMEELGNHLFNITQDSFDNQSSPAGEPWKPLSSTTLKYKKQNANKILYKDGDLQDRFIYKINKNSVVLGTNTKSKGGYLYGRVHQFGAKNAGRNKKVEIPARPFMPISIDGLLYKEVEDELLEITVEFINSSMK